MFIQSLFFWDLIWLGSEIFGLGFKNELLILRDPVMKIMPKFQNFFVGY
jgi:hypothetical protein